MNTIVLKTNILTVNYINLLSKLDACNNSNSCITTEKRENKKISVKFKMMKTDSGRSE